jgi:undecaprenyl-diphosphatase
MMQTIIDSITRLDVRWMTAIFGLNDRRRVAAVMPRISRTGDGYGYPLIAALLLLLDPSTGRAFLAAAAVAFLIEIPAFKLIKRSVRRDRPCRVLPGVESRVAPSDRFSFPSGHTAAAVLVAVLLGNLFPLLFPVAAAWALAVGLSRIILGVHYPTDVIAGMALGALSAWCGIAAAA